MTGKEMVAYMQNSGTNFRGVFSAKPGLLEPQIGHKKSSDLRSIPGVKGINFKMGKVGSAWEMEKIN